MKNLFLIIVAILMMAVPLLAQESENPQLAQIRELFRNGEFQQVVIKATAYLAEPQLTKVDSVETIRLLSMSAAQENDLDMAEKYLLVLIKLDPNTNFNPRKMSSRFSKVWNKVLRETKYVPGNQQKLLTVAVLEFTNGSFVDPDEVKNVGIGLQSMLSYSLEESGAVRTPSRDNIKYLLDELKLSQSDLVDPNQKLEIGKVLGVRNFVAGTYYNLPKGEFRIDARIINTETTESIEHFSVTGKANKIGELASQLTGEILNYFNVEADKIKAMGAKIPEVNLAALVKYSQAMAYEDMGKYEDAKSAYAEALELSPNFSLASESQEGVALDLVAQN
jgi:tetratricopeptide (TPR) repeat protein